MPRTQKPPKQPVPATAPPVVSNTFQTEVFTLAEAAAYLRFSEEDVLRLVDEQGLPARRLANEWRFLKTAIQAWLSTPSPKDQKQGIWAAAGALKDDPYLEDMLKEIDRMRGRPMAEEA